MGRLLEKPQPGWRRRLAELMRRHAIEKRPLARMAGLNERAIGQVMEKTDNPGIETMAKIARVLGVTVGYLYDGELRDRQRVRIVGCVSAGEAWMVYDDDLDEIEMAVNALEPVGVEVRGDSMAPAYRDGDILIGGRKLMNLQELVGCDCIVELTDGRRFVKYVSKGRVRGRFNLRSYNPAYPDIEDVEIEWAAPIAWICRRNLR